MINIEEQKIYDIINFHTNVNTATISISYLDFERFIKYRENKVYYVEID